MRDDEVDEDVVALAASDPANPYGWLLPWPELAGERSQGARRATGTAVVLVGGVPALYLDRSGRRLRTFTDVSEEQIERALPALRDVARYRPRGAIALERVNEESALSSQLLPQLERAGFRQDYRFLRISG